MAKLLTAFPAGALDLLGDNDQGRNINQLADQLVATADFSTHYAIAKQTVIPKATTVFGAAGFHTNGQILVPAGEIWRINAWSFGLFTAAGEAASGLLMTIVDGTGIALSEPATIAASASAFVRLQNPYWAKAGDRLGLWINSATGAPTYSGGLLVTRLRA